MAYSVNWATRVISIPKADLVLISASPEVYELDVIAFWAAIHGIQDGEGITYDTIMRSNAPLTLAGQTYVRSVEVINGYTVEFEDGQYQVNIVGANNNLVDIRVPNQVSMVGNNSAGAVVVTSGSGLDVSQATMLDEIWKRLGLDPANALTTTPASITVGGVTIALTGDGTSSSTATRQ